MRAEQKTPTDYEAFECNAGVRFFHDAGRTAVASALHSDEALELAQRNPFRYQAFRQLVRSLAAGDDIKSRDSSVDALTKRIKIINNLEEYVVDNEAGLGDSRLSNRQHDVFHDTVRFLRGELPDSNKLTQAGHIIMPTGTGKTVVFSELLKAIHTDSDSTGVKSLVLVPRKEILAQTIGSKETGQGLATFAPDLNVSAYYGEEKDASGEVVIMTYSSFNRAIANRAILPENFDVLICDEAHRALGDVTKKNIDDFRKDKLAIGLTATSSFGANKRIDSIFPTVIHRSDLRETIEQGTLSPVQAWLYRTGATIDEDLNFGDFTPGELARMANLDERNVRGAEFAKGFIQEGMQGIISCLPGEQLWHARHIADILNATWIVDAATGESRYAIARAIDGAMTMDERKALYTAFNNGEIDVLTFVDTINEGWDSKNAKFLINLRPTCSPVLGTQRLGRILRPNGNPETVAQVVDFIDETKKAQFVALHALEEYRYVLGRVYGSSVNEIGIDYRKIQIPTELRDAIDQVSHVPVKDIIVGRSYEAAYDTEVSIQELSSEIGVNPLVTLFVARELGINLNMKSGKLDATNNITFSDKDREALTQAVEENYLKTVDPEVIKMLVKKQSERLKTELVSSDHRRHVPNNDHFRSMASGTILKNLLDGRVDFDQLPSEAKEKLIDAKLGVRETTDILFGLHGYGNEPLKRAALIRVSNQLDGSAHILNCAVATGQITDFSKPKRVASNKWAITITKNDGEEVKLLTTHPESGVGGIIARYRALANFTGLLDVADSNAPKTEMLPAEKRSIQIVREYDAITKYSKGAEPIAIHTEHIVGSGENAIFHSTIQLVRSQKTYEGTGTGNTIKEAEENAARNMLENSNVRQMLETKRAKKNELKAQKEREKADGAPMSNWELLRNKDPLRAFFLKEKNRPNALIAHHQQIGNIRDVRYEILKNSATEKQYQVSFTSADGIQYSFIGGIDKSQKLAKITASKKALISEPLLSFIPELKKIVGEE